MSKVKGQMSNVHVKCLNVKELIKIIGFFLLLIFSATATFAASGDLALTAENVSFSKSTLLEGKSVRIYAIVENRGTEDQRGVVRFWSDGDQIQGDQPISVVAGKTDAVFVDWNLVAGEYAIKITAVPLEKENDDPSNNTVEKKVTVLADSDRDGIPNTEDADDDNDGVPDSEDAFPLNRNETLDSDGDGIGNNKDDDDDNDGVVDVLDAFPLNPSETLDTDKDGVGNKEDIFPLDPTQTRDFDKDGIGNEKDNDADNDGVPKEKDVNDLNLPPVIKVTSDKKPARKIVFPNEEVEFETTTSVDQDGTIGVTEWELDGEKQTGPSLRTNFKKTGIQEVKVTVIDDKGESSTETFKVLVIHPIVPWISVSVIFLILILALFFIISYSRRR